MRKRRNLLISALLLGGLAMLAFYLFLGRLERPPATVRLLPEGERIIYVNLKPLHLLLNKSQPGQLENDYRSFVEQTGIQFERDLDEAAGAWQDIANGRDSESAVIFVAHFDRERLKNYLQKLATQTESYRDHIIFSIPNEGRTVRVSLLDGTRVAVTNTASPEPMHGIIDRTHQSSNGPALLRSYYNHVPLASLAWMIDRIPANSDAAQLPGGLNFSFLENTVTVASLRYNGALLLQADVLTPTEADAKNLLDSATSFLSMYRGVSQVVGPKGNDPDVKAALDSIKVEQKGNAAVFTATFSERFVRKIVSEAQPDGLTITPAAPSVSTATPVPKLSPPPPRVHHRAQSPPSAVCSATPAEVFPGESVSATVIAQNFYPKPVLRFDWFTNGGKILGQGRKVTIDTTGVADGQTYSVGARVVDPNNEKATASCTALFRTKER